LNETTNNGEFFLPPYVATRQQKASVNPVNLTDGVIQKSILDLAKLKQKTINKNRVPSLIIFHLEKL
jgi:hypothetical protein